MMEKVILTTSYTCSKVQSECRSGSCLWLVTCSRTPSGMQLAYGGTDKRQAALWIWMILKLSFDLTLVKKKKKYTRTHLTVHNIKQRENESTRAFVTSILTIPCRFWVYMKTSISLASSTGYEVAAWWNSYLQTF